MLASATTNKASLASSGGRSSLAALRPSAPPRAATLTKRRALPLAHELMSLAAAGDVDAPIGVVVGGAIVVTLIATAIVPLALKPGDDAAQKIFSAKQKAPLDKQGPPKGKSRR